MTERQQAKAAARAEREAQEAEAARKAATKQRLIWAGGGSALAAVAAAVVVLATGGGSGDDRPVTAKLPAIKETNLATAATAAGAKTISYKWSYGTGVHTTDPVKYPTNPPTNGPHHPQWASDGDYSGRATPQTEMLVHAMEHGRIEIQYSAKLPDDQLAQLKALYDEDPAHMLLFENATDMPALVAVTAWGHGLLFKDFTPQVFDAIRAFRNTYRDKGPELVP